MPPPLSPTPAHATLDQSPLALTPEPLPYTSPLFLCSIPAGFPSPATDYIEDGLDLNEYLVRHKAASFLFRVQGHSMQGAGIVDGDKVVVDRSIEPQHNQIVIAVVDANTPSSACIARMAALNCGQKTPPSNPSASKQKASLKSGVWSSVSCVGTFADPANHVA